MMPHIPGFPRIFSALPNIQWAVFGWPSIFRPPAIQYADGVEVLEAALAARAAAVADTNSLWMFQVKEAGCKPALPGTRMARD